MVHPGKVVGDLACAQDRAQASQYNKINTEVKSNNLIMRKEIYPLMHEIGAYLRENENKVHNLNENTLSKYFDQINEHYKNYRHEFMDKMADGAIQDGALQDLFPEDLTEVSHHQLSKIEGKLKEWLDHCKNFNSQKTQDLYLMIQIGVALLSSFQSMQKDAIDSGKTMTRNQRV